MNLSEKITSDMKEAMKNQDKFSLSVLRMLKSALQLEGIQLKKELTDDEILAVIKRNVKQRKDSMVEFQKYGKTEEVENLEKEISLLKTYLPEELSEKQIEEIICQVFDEMQPQSIKDMGRIMKELTSKIGTQADMSVVSSMVKAKLQ